MNDIHYKHSFHKLAATLSWFTPRVQSASLIMTSLMMS